MTGRGAPPYLPDLRGATGTYFPVALAALERGLYPPVVVERRFTCLLVPTAATFHDPSSFLVDLTEYPDE